MKTLHLTLSKEPFEVMVTGEKRLEFRHDSKWIRSRLYDKSGNKREYDFIKFTNGYGKNKPYFVCRFLEFFESYRSLEPLIYSNGLEVSGIKKGDFVISCGDIVKRG